MIPFFLHTSRWVAKDGCCGVLGCRSGSCSIVWWEKQNLDKGMGIPGRTQHTHTHTRACTMTYSVPGWVVCRCFGAIAMRCRAGPGLIGVPIAAPLLAGFGPARAIHAI